MPYSEADFERMATDADLRRKYFWQLAQKALLRSVENRRVGALCEAERDATFGRLVLDNIEVMVEGTGQ